MEETRRCRKCGEPIPESRGPRAEDCGLPKCKSKAYRLQKKTEAEAMAAALATAARTEKESSTADTAAIPNLNRDPEQSSEQWAERSSTSCDSARSASSVQEVRLRPGQQSIVLVCGCGARTAIQISHMSAGSTSVAIPEPEATSKETLPVPAADPVSTKADESTKEVAILDSKAVANASIDPVAMPMDVPVRTEESAVAPPLVPPTVADETVKGVEPDPPVAPASTKESVALSVVHRGSETGHGNSPLHVATVKPKFQVIEIFFERRKDGAIVTWDKAKTASGTLLPAYKYAFDLIGIRGFGLAAPTSRWRSRLEASFQRGECQLPGVLIVHATRFGEHIEASVASVHMLINLFGCPWPTYFKSFRT